MKYWKKYASLIYNNCSGPDNTGKDLPYWRNNLFAITITYLLPFCLIALLPGLYWSYKVGMFMLMLVDVLTVAGIAAIALVPALNLTLRKVIFISACYILSATILYYLGLTGPGLSYLLCTCLFSIILFHTSFKYWPAWVNTIICILFGIAIFFELLPWKDESNHSVGEWIAVCTNIIFMGFLFSALLPHLFNGLQKTINNEKELKDKLEMQQVSLQNALHKLQQKNNELEQFAYIVSHDLKEPIRMVSNFMSLLKTKCSEQLDVKATTYVDFALDGATRMQKMITDLLDLSRTARDGDNKEIVDLNEIINEVKQNLFKLIEENNTEIIVKTNLPALYAHRDDMTRLLQNLFTNAIRYRKKEVHPIILMNVTDKDDDWLFEIRDNGIGIEPDKFEKIFEIFARLHTREQYEGTGIGLAICKKIVEQNGGKLWVESMPGTGSTFYFNLKKTGAK